MTELHLQLEQASERLAAARALMSSHRRQGLAALNQLFRSGTTPRVPLAGRYAGRFEAFDIAPGLSQAAAAIAKVWMPWRGKAFRLDGEWGENILTKDSFALARLAASSYHAFMPDSLLTYRAFPFQTGIKPGRQDPDRLVLAIDYDVPPNPGWSVRRIQDELMQLDNGLFLGKAHVHWWWGSWQLWAYFSLHGPVDDGTNPVVI